MPDRPLSFCMVTTFYPPYHFGGDAMYVHRLSHALAERGHRVTVVHCSDAYKVLGGAAGGELPSHPRVTVRRLSSRLGAVSPLVTYLAGRPGLKARALSEIFAQERFDVVHFHNVSLVGGPGVLRYGDGVKLYTTHEHWLVCPMHVLWKLDREPCVEPQCLRCTLAFRRPPQLWRYSRLLEREAQHVDLFLSPSRFTIEMHRARGFTRPIRHLPYFLPTPTGRENGGGTPWTERPYFLFVGRLERLKGVQTLIERFRSYDAADLLIAGEGKHGDELRREAADLAHVRFLGRVHPDDLGLLYADAIALIVPSIGYETFGIVSLEAFAQGTPVIVRELGGLTEAVEDGGGGLTYRTEEELLERMELLRRDTALRDELGRNGHRALVERWSTEPHLAEYFDAIEEARARRRGRVAQRGVA